MIDESNDSYEIPEFRPSGREDCENCGSGKNVQKFNGSRLCKNCRNQLMAMR